MIDSVKPHDGEGACNSEMDPDERESRETLNTIISTIVALFTVFLSKITLLDLVKNTSHVGALAHPFAWTEHFVSTFLLWSTLEWQLLMIYHQSFNSTHFMSSITTYFTIILFMKLTTPVKKTRHKICHFFKKTHSVREKSPNHSWWQLFCPWKRGNQPLRKLNCYSVAT